MATISYDIGDSGVTLYAIRSGADDTKEYEFESSDVDFQLLCTHDPAITSANPVAAQTIGISGIIKGLPNIDGTGSILAYEINLPSNITPINNFDNANEASGFAFPIQEIDSNVPFVKRSGENAFGIVVAKPVTRRIRIVRNSILFNVAKVGSGNTERVAVTGRSQKTGSHNEYIH